MLSASQKPKEINGCLVQHRRKCAHTPQTQGWRMEPHIKGWETTLATDEARLRAALKPRKAKLI